MSLIDIELITLVFQSSSEIRLTCLYRPTSTNNIIHDLICDFISKLCESINSIIIVPMFF